MFQSRQEIERYKLGELTIIGLRQTEETCYQQNFSKKMVSTKTVLRC